MTRPSSSPNRAGRFAVAALIFVAAAVAATRFAVRRPALPVISSLPEFHLVDQTGAPLSNADLRGRVWIASFIYTRCTGPCPVIVERLHQVARRLADVPNLAIVSFTVDPQYDTPEVLAAYGRKHRIDPSRWKLVTGPIRAVIGLIREGFYLPVERNAGGDPQRAAVVTHSVRLVLVDQAGRIRAYYDSGSQDDLDRLVNDVRWLAKRKKVEPA